LGEGKIIDDAKRGEKIEKIEKVEKRHKAKKVKNKKNKKPKFSPTLVATWLKRGAY
jgi:hypothetical protein